MIQNFKVVTYFVFTLTCVNATGAETKMNDVWGLVEGIRTVNADKMSVRKLFDAEFDVISNYDFGTKYAGRGPDLSDGLHVTEFGIIVYKDGTEPAINAYLSGRCVKADEAERTYPGIAMFSGPSHGYPDATVSYLLENGKRELQFFFNVRSGCLVSIKSVASVRVKPVAVNAALAPGQ